MGCTGSKPTNDNAAAEKGRTGGKAGKGPAKGPQPKAKAAPKAGTASGTAITLTGPNPPDLKGQISNMSTIPVHETSTSSVYTGTYKGEKVALKVLKDPRTGDAAKLSQKMSREMKILFQLKHPHIIPLYGYDSSIPNSIVGAMISPWYPNGHARHYIKAKHPSLEVRIDLLLNVAEGLIYLHDSGVVHGDIKPENIFIAESGRAVLADFGLSHLVVQANAPNLDAMTYHIPTARYCAAELITSNPPVPPSTKESDVWSLGAVALEFIFETIPYSTIDNFAQVIVAISEQRKPAQRPSNAQGRDRDLWVLIESCWALPQKRPTAANFARRLRELQIRQPAGQITPSRSSSPKPSSPPTSPMSKGSRPQSLHSVAAKQPSPSASMTRPQSTAIPSTSTATPRPSVPLPPMPTSPKASGSKPKAKEPKAKAPPKQKPVKAPKKGKETKKA